MSSRGKTLALLGGPESGKTTYLGSLADGLNSGACEHLTTTALAPDSRALEQLSEPILQGRYPQRTKAERHALELHLATRGGILPSTELVLAMGDYDGEEVERLFATRASGWTPEWQARGHADALLIFIRPDSASPLPRFPRPCRASPTWSDLQEHPSPRRTTSNPARTQPADLFGPGLTLEDEVISSPPAIHDPVSIPTALSVIELLQFLRKVRGLEPGERPPAGTFRVAILVSAWDAIDPSWRAQGPTKWLAQEMALFEDTLWSNFRREDTFRFGLSSTGGDLRNESYRRDFGGGGFVEWADSTGVVRHTRDLALPLYWALFGDLALATARE